MIEKERIKILNKKSINTNGEFVVYWMQSSQRVEYNHALEYSIRRANELKKPLIVYFGLTNDYPEANYRHYMFMIEGLLEVEEELKKINIKMIIKNIYPELGAINISKKAVLMITDRGYLRHERNWREKVALSIEIPLVQIETNLMVPIEEVSNKEEYSAFTIRKKLHKLIDFYTKPINMEVLEISSINLFNEEKSINLNDISNLNIDYIVNKSIYYKGGTSEAKNQLSNFIKDKINKYDKNHSDPSLDYQSNMSPYLHFGQISPLYIYEQLVNVNNKEKYLEELIIRRELAFNFVYYNPNYDSFECLPNWAVMSLNKHLDDEREYFYDLETFENYKTHDIYWNTAQKEMVITGKMHGYMRMYWGKKIIEWTKSPTEAYKIMIYLNNKYNIDGRDPNSYAGIAWCFGKHDRPWKERQIFGMIRYMNYEGLDRKFNMNEYVNRINKM